MTTPKLRETTDADRRQWQLHAGLALCELLSQACTDGLPLLAWKLTTVGLVGEVPCSYGRRDEDADYRRWCEHLGAVSGSAKRTLDGVLHLRASASYRMRRGHDVQVTIVANLQPQPQQQDIFRESA